MARRSNRRRTDTPDLRSRRTTALHGEMEVAVFDAVSHRGESRRPAGSRLTLKRLADFVEPEALEENAKRYALLVS